ncbi:MAG: hypothetical protein AAB336_00045 [Acidobacteriota bacterium]
MKLKDKLLKVLLVFVLASVAINLSSSSPLNCDEKNAWACNPSVYNEPVKIFDYPISSFNQPDSPLLGYLFQLMFILFFISPPLIAVILFLIWKELKERNKMK